MSYFLWTFCQRPKLTFELFLLARMIAFALNPSTFAPSPSTVRHQFSLGPPSPATLLPLNYTRLNLSLPSTKPAEPSPCEQTKATSHSDALFQHEGNKQKVTDITVPAAAGKCSKTHHLSFNHESSHVYTCRSYGSGCSYSLGCGYD